MLTNPLLILLKTYFKEASNKYTPDNIEFLTDGETENVNQTVGSFIKETEIPIAHLIVQKDVIYSNSMIESVNKVIKHQFLFHKTIKDKNDLEQLLPESVSTYNTVRPQFSLDGNTPEESFTGSEILFPTFSQKFKRTATNKKKTPSKKSM